MAVTETDYATIVVSATHGKLGVVRNAQITSNTIQMIKVQFDFKTSDWDNLTKTAVFWRESDMADQNMDAKILMVLDNQGQCSIPSEMTVDDENTFLIGLYGVSSGTDLKRMVSNWIPFHVVRGCYGGGSASQAPTADVYEQLLSKLTYMAGTNVSIANNVISVTIPDTLATKTYVDEKSGKIDSIQVNGVPQTITNKAVNINIPTKTSQLSNDSNFVTTSYHDSTKSDITHNHDGIYLKEHQNISGKQDVITDLSAIRAGAALGATSLQELPEHIHTDEEIAMSGFGVNLRGFAQSALSSVNDLSYTVADLGGAVSDMNTVLGSKLSDAPSDGKQYARQDGAWAEVTGGEEPLYVEFYDLEGDALCNVSFDTINAALQRGEKLSVWARNESGFLTGPATYQLDTDGPGFNAFFLDGTAVYWVWLDPADSCGFWKINLYSLKDHTTDTTVHVTSSDKTNWNGKVGEAPSDGKQYARRNGAWEITSAGSGTDDYNKLGSKPSINNVALIGNKTSEQLGLSPENHTHSYSELTDKPTVPTVNNPTVYYTTTAGDVWMEAFTLNQTEDVHLDLTASVFETIDYAQDNPEMAAWGIFLCLYMKKLPAIYWMAEIDGAFTLPLLFTNWNITQVGDDFQDIFMQADYHLDTASISDADDIDALPLDLTFTLTAELTLYGIDSDNIFKLTVRDNLAEKQAISDALESMGEVASNVDDLGDRVSDIEGSYVGDAPSDGNTYARKDGAWEAISAGSSDYSKLANKPSINNVTLSGNTTLDAVGAAEKNHTHTASDIGAFTQQSYSVVANTYINNTDGREIAYSGWDSTDYIELAGDQLKCVWNTSSTWNAFYDESKRYISSPTFGAGGATVIIPAKAKYVRLSNTSTAMRTLEVYALSSLTGMLDGISGRVKDIEDKESVWNSKQDVITDIDAIRSGAALGATALQSYTEIDPTVPNWAKQANKPTYTAAEIGALPSDTEIPSQMYYVITEDMFDINYDSTLGQSPYSTSYGYSEITISDDVGVEWKNGAVYRFVLDTKIAKTPYRNVRVRIGENGTWIPITSYAGSASAQYGIFVKGHNTTFCYETKYISTGALTHMNYDTNTTYAYLANTVLGDATDSSVQIDSSGYGARYSLIFPTTPISSILDGTERWSSPMLSSSTSTSKKVFAGKLYLDRAPLYVYSANIAAGGKPINSLYQAYTNGALYSYLANTNSTYVTTRKRCYMWLKDFDAEELTFYADNTIGNVMSEDKITTRFPSSTQGDIYLLYLGRNNATWGNWQPDFVCHYRIYKYTPSTGVFVDTKISVG